MDVGLRCRKDTPDPFLFFRCSISHLSPPLCRCRFGVERVLRTPSGQQAADNVVIHPYEEKMFHIFNAFANMLDFYLLSWSFGPKKACREHGQPRAGRPRAYLAPTVRPTTPQNHTESHFYKFMKDFAWFEVDCFWFLKDFGWFRKDFGRIWKRISVFIFAWISALIYVFEPRPHQIITSKPWPDGFPNKTQIFHHFHIFNWKNNDSKMGPRIDRNRFVEM